jgi:glutathione S-transferase
MAQQHVEAPGVYRLLGGPGSPYSLKMRAVLRYRRLPHHWIVPRGYIGVEGELARAGKKIIPVLQYPQGDYWADSTPLVYDLEQRHPGVRAVVPGDAAAAFLAHLIEDMADEMLVIAMFDLRWGSAADQAFCARRQMSGWLSPIPSAEFEALIERFTARQTATRAQWVQSDGAHLTLMELYHGVLQAIERMLDQRAYLFGSRPSLADFGLYGQLSQCAIDPSASAILRASAPRTFQWTQSLDDASGVDGEWCADGDWGVAVPTLLALCGRFHLPLLRGHYLAVEDDTERVVTEIAGRPWHAAPDRYKHRCWVWLQREWQALPPSIQERLRPVLVRAGCQQLLEPATPSRVAVPSMAPR